MRKTFKKRGRHHHGGGLFNFFFGSNTPSQTTPTKLNPRQKKVLPYTTKRYIQLVNLEIEDQFYNEHSITLFNEIDEYLEQNPTNELLQLKQTINNYKEKKEEENKIKKEEEARLKKEEEERLKERLKKEEEERLKKEEEDRKRLIPLISTIYFNKGISYDEWFEVDNNFFMIRKEINSNKYEVVLLNSIKHDYTGNQRNMPIYERLCYVDELIQPKVGGKSKKRSKKRRTNKRRKRT